MAYIYYNPAVMSNPGTTLTRIRSVDPDDKWVKARMRIRKPYESREAALSDDSSCFVYFYENGVLYEAERTGSWAWKPCTEPVCDPGINWHTYYAPTVDGLREYIKSRYTTISDFTPRLNEYGLYEIQVHYDGRCR